jgi:hypothetical protein
MKNDAEDNENFPISNMPFQNPPEVLAIEKKSKDPGQT